MSLTPGATLGPYTIRAELGHGGMGIVYTAQDPRLKRQVAIKLLTPDLTRDEIAKQRFLQEAQAASALDHPNICTIYEINETADGQLYLVMAYYEGETLKQRIERGPLKVDEAVDIATQVGRGLAEAHGAGIVHRDIKPANLLIAKGGVVKILDFGLAKLAGAEGVTQTGTTVGTVAYMSPEQARGEEVDHRTDIWSLGVVLYEMVTGEQPFQGENLLALSGAIQRDPPPALARDSSALNPVVGRSLQKSRSQRYESATGFVSALQRVGGDGPSATTSTQSEVPSIAVLPFASLSRDPEDEFLADGVTEEITNSLAHISGLRVAGRSSAFSFKGKNENLRTVGAKLNVATLLEGTLRRAGNRLRITAQLSDVSDGYQLWSERYDRVIEDVFEVQEEIANAIVGRLRVSLSTDVNSLVRPHTDNLRAYELYLKGRALLYQRGPSIPRALECFKSAVALDADYAQAWAGLADGYTTFGYSGFGPGMTVMPKALEAARRALALDPDLAEAHNALACGTMLYELDYELAEQEFRRALELNPNYPQASAWYGLFFLQFVAGREPEASEVLAQLRRLDALSAYAHTVFAFSSYTRGQPTEAVDYGRRAVELDPQSFLGHFILTLALHGSGRFEEAAAIADRALAMSGRHIWALTSLVVVYAGWGKQEEARSAYREAEARRASEYVQPSMLAMAAAAVGNLERAIALARAALDEKDPMFVLIARTWPEYQRLRTDPRFRKIVHELHFPN